MTDMTAYCKMTCQISPPSTTRLKIHSTVQCCGIV